MYTSIKAYSQKSFMKFYLKLNGSKTYSDKKITFDVIDYDDIQITFYCNLTILFRGFLSKKIKLLIDIIIDKELYVGSDEVGVGETIGPMVAVALRFNSYEDKKIVILNGIKDSKKMSAKEIQEKAKFIMNHSTYYVANMIPETFNKKYKLLPNVKAINALMQNQLHKKFEGKGYKHITDQFVNEKKYKEYILNSNNKPFKGNLLLLTKAEEKYLEVSAAAIIDKSIYNIWIKIWRC
ncbi:MAG: hypothetical protein HRS50_01055 [Mycoplasmataceae bacterium]|nr:hypothetical protein [Mycoplasmataceae bacterium]